MRVASRAVEARGARGVGVRSGWTQTRLLVSSEIRRATLQLCWQESTISPGQDTCELRAFLLHLKVRHLWMDTLCIPTSKKHEATRFQAIDLEAMAICCGYK